MSEASIAGAEPGAQLKRLVLERHPVRAIWTRLDGAWRELTAHRAYPPAVSALLGEAATASVLLAATLKFQGTLSLQLAGQGPVRLLVAQCTHDLKFRAMAQLADTALAAQSAAAAPAALGVLVGQGAHLTVTIEAEERAARYQGIVALDADSLAGCLESYFAASEQLPTRIALSADARHASGVLLQRMPGEQPGGETEAAGVASAWAHLGENLQSLQSSLLQAAGAEQVLQRICGEHDARLFAGTPVRFACRCGRERVGSLLRALGRSEVQQVLAEQGAVGVTCEFCGRSYRFDAIDVERLFAGEAPPPPSASLH